MKLNFQLAKDEVAQDFANYIRMMKKKYTYVSKAKGMEIAKDFLDQELKKAYEKTKSGVRNSINLINFMQIIRT